MGCMKSKQTFPFPNTFDTEKQSKESFLVDDRFLPRKPSSAGVQEKMQEAPVTSVAITNFAEHLSQKVISEAIQQWASNNIKYHDIPYIESDGQ